MHGSQTSTQHLSLAFTVQLPLTDIISQFMELTNDSEAGLVKELASDVSLENETLSIPAMPVSAYKSSGTVCVLLSDKSILPWFKDTKLTDAEFSTHKFIRHGYARFAACMSLEGSGLKMMAPEAEDLALARLSKASRAQLEKLTEQDEEANGLHADCCAYIHAQMELAVVRCAVLQCATNKMRLILLSVTPLAQPTG